MLVHAHMYLLDLKLLQYFLDLLSLSKKVSSMYLIEEKTNLYFCKSLTQKKPGYQRWDVRGLVGVLWLLTLLNY